MRVQSQRQPIRGLNADEVAERRARGLGSVPPPATSRSYLQIIWENVFTTVNIILFSVGFALVLVGQYLDALVSVGVISFNLVISLIQEIRAKRTLDRIALLTRPQATVVRDGREQQLDPGEIVVDDILVLHPGDQIVVDGPLIDDGRVEVDESLLFRRRFDKLEPFCRIAGHTSEEVRAILATLETVYQPLFPQLNPAINGQVLSTPG